ncbi:MAG: ATP-binding protein [Bacteroidota bacterium]
MNKTSQQLQKKSIEYSREELLSRIQQLEADNHALRESKAHEVAELVRSETNLLALIEGNSDLILSVDLSYCILVINSAMQQQMLERYGIMVQAGMNLYDILGEEDRAFFMPFKGQLKQGHTVKSIEQIRDGSDRYHECMFFPIYDGRTQINGYAFFAKDITERHKAEQEVRKSQQLLASINYSIKEGIFRTTPEGEIIYVNRAFLDMFGFEKEEDVFKLNPSTLYIDTKRREDFRRIIEEQNYFTNEEVEFKRKDGSTFWGLVSSIRSVGENGEIFNDGAIRDVTQSRKSEQTIMEQNYELRKVNRELDQLVYSTSHDLRAPLVSILGLINIAREEEELEMRNRYLGLMEKSINKLDNFIKDIIGYSRNSRVEVKQEEIDFSELVAEAYGSLYYAQEYENISKRLEISGNANFISDSTRLQIILNNLLANACRYADPEKEEQFVEVRIDCQPDNAIISVADNGIGIEAQYLDRIFNMFYRATKKSKGSGIGLYIVKEAVNKLGGSINVASEPGQGTCFTMVIPALKRETIEES